MWQAEHAAEFGVAAVAWVRSDVVLVGVDGGAFHCRGIHRVLGTGQVAGLAVGQAGDAIFVAAGRIQHLERFTPPGAWLEQIVNPPVLEEAPLTPLP